MSSNPIVIKPEPVVVRISPLGFHRYASEFLRAARSVSVDSSFSPVPYYLYCRSLELALKAFLLTKNVSIRELKSRHLGHDLVKVLDKAKTIGLGQLFTVTSAHERELVKANNYYTSKGFEYFEVMKAHAITGSKSESFALYSIMPECPTARGGDAWHPS